MGVQSIDLREFHKTLPDLLDCLYRSIYDDSAAQTFMKNVGRISGATNVVLSFSGGDELPGKFSTIYGQELIATYLPMRLHDPWMTEVMQRSNRAAVLGTELVSSSVLRKTEMYEHVYRPLNIEYMAASGSTRESGLPSYLCIQRSDDDFDDSVKLLLETFHPHLNRIEGIYQAYLNGSVRSTSTLPMADTGSLVEHVYAQWAAVFGSLGLAPYSYECLSQPLVPRFVTPLMDEDEVFRWLVTVVPDVPAQRISVYVRLFPELPGLIDLSSAESRLMTELIRGYSIPEICRIFGRSRNTIKTQMRNVLAKLGQKSQRELLDHFPP